MTGLMAVVRALRFHSADEEPLRAIREEAWTRLLEQTDEARLTLPLGICCRDALPTLVRARIDRDLARNALRRRRLRSTLRDIAQVLDTRKIDYVFLKGDTHWPYFCDAPQRRPQYDIDLFSPEPAAARQVIGRLGFESLNNRNREPVDHLPVMVRKTSWRWRGDYYDPEQPPSVEIHFRFWSPETERFSVEGPERFWLRRTVRDCGGLALPCLSLPDTLSYAVLHSLRHLLRGDLRLYQLYELAHFLEASAADAQFWNDWAAQTPRSFRDLQGVIFQLGSRWFHCRLHPLAKEATETLTCPVRVWCERFGFSPITGLDRPNKDELLLHFCLVGNATDAARVVARRMFPRPRSACGWRFAVLRAAHHALALPSFIGSLVRWQISGRQLLPRSHKPRAGSAPG